MAICCFETHFLMITRGSIGHQAVVRMKDGTTGSSNLFQTWLMLELPMSGYLHPRILLQAIRKVLPLEFDHTSLLTIFVCLMHALPQSESILMYGVVSNANPPDHDSVIS